MRGYLHRFLIRIEKINGLGISASTSVKPYTEIPVLAGVLLEYSYVVGIKARPASLRFDLDAVLTPEHPAYTDPVPGEQFCFRRASLHFGDVQGLLWSAQGASPAVDANGEQDFGSIDRFEWDDAGFELEGDWGHLSVVAGRVEFRLESDA